MKLTPVIFASSNHHKFSEIEQLFKDVLPVKFEKNPLDVEETGSTFFENAYLKAKAYFDHHKVGTLSDDSGLCVDALPNDLGLHTARFGGADLDQSARNQLVLKKMLNENNRSAYFVCVLCLYLSPGEVYFFEGRLDGQIAQNLAGDGGFGYDPLFIPTGKTESLASLHEWKMEHSHRAKAVNGLKSFLRERNNSVDNFGFSE